MKKVLMYTKDNCPYCHRAEQLLKLRGVEQIDYIRIDQEGQEAMVARTQYRTVPQIFIGDTHVGGYDQLAALDLKGELLPLLNKI